MNKITLYLGVTTGASIIIYEDLFLHILFGFFFVGLMLESDRIDKTLVAIFKNALMSSIMGWVVALGFKHFFPYLFIGGIKIVSLFVTTILSYFIVLEVFKKKYIENFLEKLATILIDKTEKLVNFLIGKK